MLWFFRSLVILASLLLVGAAIGFDGYAEGKDVACRPACQKCCKIVCEMKKVKKTVWAVECEEFCVPRPSLRGCCVTCGKVRCRRKLLKKEITVEVPVYKCVVVDCTCKK